MAKTPENFEVFEAEVLGAKGKCSAGHQPGDRLSLSCWDPGGLCGFFYHDIFPALSVMQFGGKYPWAPTDEVTLSCPDKQNQVTVKIRRV